MPDGPIEQVDALNHFYLYRYWLKPDMPQPLYGLAYGTLTLLGGAVEFFKECYEAVQDLYQTITQ